MQNHLYKALQEHERIVEIYKRDYAKKPDKRDWRTYEQRLALRIKTAAKEIKPVVHEAYSLIHVRRKGPGSPEKVSTEKKVFLLLLKDIFQLSNRKMANLLAMFTALTDIDISYKTVERCYSDPLARMTIHNMFVILTERKGIKEADTSGDGTGYSLTITRHYRTVREKELKDMKKEGSEKKSEKGKKRLFVRAFALRDLDTGLYIGFGTSMKSEKEAFDEALKMTREMGITINSSRLDKLYSHQSITKKFGKDTTLYIIPKKNATIRGSPEWKRMIRRFVDDQIGFLREYYKRNNSESDFSRDKRMCGWTIVQKKDERIDTALFCKGVWHNLMLMA